MTFVIDLDDTLLLYPDKKFANIYQKYKEAIPNQIEINMLNEFYEQNHVIIIHTGRNWDKYDITVKQLKKFKIKYHELVMGKPQGIYIDKDSHRSLEERIV